MKLLPSVEADPALLQFMDSCVDKCFHDVECRVADKRILQRQLTGPSSVPGVAHVKPKNLAKAKRKGGPAEDLPVKKYISSPQSSICTIQAKPYAPPPKGNGDHLPQHLKTYCEYCNKWIETESVSQHQGGRQHKTNETSMKSSDSKCKCDNSWVIVLMALNFCCRHVVPNL